MERRRRVLRRRRSAGLAASALALLVEPGAAPRPTALPPTAEVAHTPTSRIVVTAAALTDGESRTNIARLFKLLAECDARTGPGA
jgi:hypothetical protein